MRSYGTWLLPLFRVVLGAALLAAGLPMHGQAAVLPAPPRAAAASPIPNTFGWQDELVDQQGQVGASSAIALDSNGFAHITYYDFTQHALKYAAWDGVAWQRDTVESGLGVFTDTFSLSSSLAKVSLPPILPKFSLRSSLALYGGTTFIVYEKNDDLTGVRSVRYAFGGIGGWNISTLSPATASTFAYAPMLRIDSNHNLHVTYTLRDRLNPSSAQKIIYARLDFTATGWLSQTVDTCDCWNPIFNVDHGVDTTLALDASSRPHIAYASEEGRQPFKYAWLNGATWQSQNVDIDGQSPSMAVDTAGIAHIAYITTTVDVETNNAIKYASWNGSTWQIENVLNCRCDTAPSLALDVFDRPRIAIRDQGPTALKFLAFDGANWQYANLINSSVYPHDPALALDSAGNAHISYLDAKYDDLHHVAWAPNWQTQTVALTGDEAHLAVDLHNLPYISYGIDPMYGFDYPYVHLANWTPGGYWQYREALPFPAEHHSLRLEYDVNRQPLPIFSYLEGTDILNPHLGFAQWNGASFVTQTVDGSNPLGFNTSLAFDHQANPIIGYIGYQHLSDGWHPLIKYAVSSNYGQTWDTRADTAAATLGFNSGLRSLSIGGSPYCCNSYIAYYETTSKALRLATWNGTQWTDELVDGGNGDDVGLFVSLAVDRTSGKPAMAYLDATHGDVHYAFWRGAWLTETVDSGVQAVSDLSLSLALYSDQYPRVAYTARVDKSLRLAWTTVPSSTWTIETVATFVTNPDTTRPPTRLSFQTQERDHIAFSQPAAGVVYAFHSATLPYSLYFNPLQPCVDVQPPDPATLGGTLARVRALAPSALVQVDDLTTLRALRDLFALSPAGRHYVDLYYQYSRETGALALANPALLWDAYRALQNFIPGFQALAAGRGASIVITQSMVDRANDIADRLVAGGTPALGAAINLERGNYHHLQDFVGETFDKAANTLGVVAHALYLPLMRR